jgi:hypothetical protein
MHDGRQRHRRHLCVGRSPARAAGRRRCERMLPDWLLLSTEPRPQTSLLHQSRRGDTDLSLPQADVLAA